MTYRERREAKAARLREWAEKRQEKAQRGYSVGEHLRGDTAFWTQPGRIPQRDAIHRAHQRAYQDDQKGREMAARAAGIEAQADRAIYSDDEDAIERLEERIAELEAQRERMKAENATFRKAHAAEIKPLTQWQRDQIMPHASFTLTNLGANIRRNRERLDKLR
jgi:predicted RNase H-like nuclease (RuvC/YqgF family)